MDRRTLLLGVAAAALGVSACTTRGAAPSAAPGGTAAPTAGAASTAAAASGYPTKDITLIVQAAAGGGSDLSSRALATAMEPILGKSIIVENRPGAAGSTAMLYVKGQPADGYTIGFGPVEIAMLGSLNYDIKPSDFDLLGQIMLGPGVLSVPPSPTPVRCSWWVTTSWWPGSPARARARPTPASTWRADASTAPSTHPGW